MANTIVQNCQRGIIFISFLIVLMSFIFTIISLIKKRIDSTDDGGNGDRYEQGKEKPVATGTEQSAEKIDQAVVDRTQVKEDDPTIIKAIKKYNEFMFNYFALMILVPLNILTGTSKAFCFVWFFFILIVVIVFNLAQIHRKCIDHKCVRAVIENLWIGMLFFQLVNIWGATSTLQPYIVVPK